MRLASTLVRSSRAKRILDIGTGCGYSALWLAEAAGACARVEGIDRFDDHAARCTGFAEVAGLSERVSFLVGVGGELLSHLVGPYGVVHEDAWFAAQPAYFERIVELLKPCGLLTMPNWFLLTDAIAGVRHRRWADYGRVARHDGRLTTAYRQHGAASSHHFGSSALLVKFDRNDSSTVLSVGCLTSPTRVLACCSELSR